MCLGRNDVIRHATFASLPGEERMVFTFYTKHSLTTLMAKLDIVKGTAFFDGPDDQDWTVAPPGWGVGGSEVEASADLGPRNGKMREWRDGAKARCWSGGKLLPVKVGRFLPDGPLLEPELGPCYEVRWLVGSGKEWSTVPKAHLSGPERGVGV